MADQGQPNGWKCAANDPNTSSQTGHNSSAFATASGVTRQLDTKEPATREQKATVMCGFAAIGKSSLIKKAYKKDYYNGLEVGYYDDIMVVDLDSGDFSKKAEWPDNYLEAISLWLSEHCILMISTHLIIYRRLLEEGVDLLLVHPGPKYDDRVKEEWKKRILRREKANKIPDARSMWPTVEVNWNEWIKEYEDYEEQYSKHCVRHEMSGGDYLLNAADEIPKLKDIPQLARAARNERVRVAQMERACAAQTLEWERLAQLKMEGIRNSGGMDAEPSSHGMALMTSLDIFTRVDQIASQ